MGVPPEPSRSPLREIARLANAPEAEVVERLGAIVPFDAVAERVIEREALALAEAVRSHRTSGLSAEGFLGHFGLAAE